MSSNCSPPPGLLVAVLAIAAAVSHADPKRAVPDYDGRGNLDADAESWLLWIPRVVLSPLYLANEYVLRRPVGAVFRRAERGRWSDTVAHLFTFGEGGRSTIVPIASFDLGVLPRAGLDYTRDAAIAAGNALELELATWGPRWIEASLADRYAIDGADRVALRLAGQHSEDNLFVGLGPDATDGARARYGLERVEAGAAYRRQLTGAARLDAETGVHRVAFVSGTCCGDPSLDTRIAHAEVMAPPGYRDSYTAAYGRIGLTIDTRRAAPDARRSGYLHVDGAPSFDLRGGRSWITYGAELGGAIDLTGHRRVLGADLAVSFTDPVTGDAVPFTEYAALGGERMPGFVPGWLIGPSEASGQLGYSWPLWLGLDARTRIALGNAFDRHLAGLSPGKLRLSGDIALMSSTERDRGFEVVLGLGTETFEQGAAVTSVRVMLGSKRGL